MNISTRFFGDIKIDAKQIINFKNGIPGMEHLKKYAILDDEENDNLKFMQSVEDKDICFMITEPWSYFKDYEIELSEYELKELEILNETDVLVYNIITVRENVMTVNLAAPIVVNIINNKSKQIILTNSNYKVRQEIPCLY